MALAVERVFQQPARAEIFPGALPNGCTRRVSKDLRRSSTSDAAVNGVVPEYVRAQAVGIARAQYVLTFTPLRDAIILRWGSHFLDFGSKSEVQKIGIGLCADFLPGVE